MKKFLLDLLFTLPAVLVAITMHEFAHGLVSAKLGDPTPEATGRLSLNPFRHLDPVGILCLIFFHFGWAKPVQVNPYYYKNKKGGMVAVALAGPLMNFLIAFLCTFGMGIILKTTGGYASEGMYYLFQFLNYGALLNIGLGAFNLIPIPPLDGSKVLGAVLPEQQYFGYMRYERYGSLVLVALLAIGVLDVPLGYMQAGIQNGLWTVVNAIFGL